MRWTPHVTVAAIIHKENQFLLVEEKIDDKLLLNQPAGHWENGETLIEAVIRETLEETAWYFKPEFLVGIYQWQHPEKLEKTYLRFAFSGSVGKFDASRPLDKPIVRTIWADYNTIIKTQFKHRSPQLLRCVDDFLQGYKVPLSFLINLK